MATHTDYFNLEKPESYENYNIAVFNNNADTIDLQMHNNQTSAAKVMVGATSLADGESGRVPTPHAGDEDKYLKGDGTWAAGNSNVEANPSGTPTETLETIGIDNVIYQLPEGGDTEITGDVEGSVISIDDGKLNEPLKACTVEINPVQSGSGTPSPSNIRPISGWSGANIANISDVNAVEYFKGLTLGTYAFIEMSSLSWSEQADGIFRTSVPRTYGTGNFNLLSSRYTTYTGAHSTVSNIQNLVNINGNGLYVNSGSATFFCADSAYTDETVFKNSLQGVYLLYQLANPTTPTITPTQFNTLLTAFGLNGYMIPVSWQTEAGTIYGGELDVTSGVLTVTDGYIASYDGETLPSTWISDRDVYAEGTTPTTGAEVVYKLATPTEVSLTPTEITTLYGNNNIWADSGDMAITYVRDTSIAINDALNQSITPTYSSGTKIADYNVGGHTGSIYVQGAGGQMDTLWTGDVKPTSDSMPTVQLAYPLSGYDYIVVEGYGTYTYYTTDAIYKPVIGRTYVGKLNGEISYCAVLTIINDSNVQLRYWGSAGSNTNIVGIYGVKI